MCRALNQVRAATTKKFEFERVDHEQIAEKQQALVKTQKKHGTNDQESLDAMTAVEITEKSGLHNSRDMQ